MSDPCAGLLRGFLVSGNSMNKKYLYIAGGVIASLLLLHACSDDNQTASTQPVLVQPAPQVQQAPQPVIVQGQPPQPVVIHESDNGGFFSGMLMGHLMSGGHSYHTHTTIVKRYTSPRYSAPSRYYGSRGFNRRSTYRSTFRSYSRRR